MAGVIRGISVPAGTGRSAANAGRSTSRKEKTPASPAVNSMKNNRVLKLIA
jgi:hypothetical protein